MKPIIDKDTKRIGRSEVTGIPVFSINPSSKEPEGTPSLIFRIQMAPSPLPRINWPRLLIIILLTFSDLIPLLMQEMIYKSGCNRQSKAVNKGRTLSLIPFQICRNFTIL
jgi:hypothetical protein